MEKFLPFIRNEEYAPQYTATWSNVKLSVDIFVGVLIVYATGRVWEWIIRRREAARAAKLGPSSPPPPT